MTNPGATIEKLCLVCGICCNGVLFKDVELQPGDDAGRLRTLAHPLETRRGRIRFPQPCAALGVDCRCRIYADRPVRCRDFECGLLQNVLGGRMEADAALRTIRATLRRAGEVKELLHELGDTEETLALSLRFQRMRKRLEAGTDDEETAETYSRLTLAVHDLNLRLRQSFYS